ncbi:glycerol-3-phosphate 1-O-acyltransferase PlsY [Mesobacillus subterraneus]|jgi:acyl phosphate:glycerol-3-phosphate acyltransferase|uniref:glycerol-3-phosphate 1-O-acyltransferase PlsY n=1 Tax=Mesobacillus subterraneus TaxID=285983 RepID=UPI00203F4298|nr:glycerol-3-phosphate 1-O-acyltransferase PlsY [Mesobacillus subterraneus]MCM3666569.1 glycerol-3-phosphate 1-O-acyltransferase PlsY [Mesobacillus subterraneus]MCM3685937.1 glycerol-3-phosphate 1-O-acyltransferase PlsY [Mesobacillus subterraneus]
MTWIILLAAYLIGSIPTALLIGKYFFNVDIRDHGSKNPGATNTLRVMGKKAAIIVLLVDVVKGMLAASLPLLLDVPLDPLYSGLIAVIGHCFPIFAGFRGGKAIATTAGALLIVDFGMFLAVYLTFFAVMFMTKYVFMGSISVGFAMLLYSFFSTEINEPLIFAAFIVFLIFLHRSNLQNFFNGTEPKINDKKVKGDRLPPKDSFKS